MNTARSAAEVAASTLDTADLARLFAHTRQLTDSLCEPLETEDFIVQSMPDASPVRWHLAHTTWFFETFVLMERLPGYRPFNPAYRDLFNSYYNAVGTPLPRSRRGVLSRPTVAEVRAYRAHVDDAMAALFESDLACAVSGVIEIGIHHECQHQELILTDLKHAFSCNPLFPAYADQGPRSVCEVAPLRWVEFPEAVRWVGHDGSGFGYDNESPRHREFVPAFALADRLVTTGEYVEFIDDGGYQRPELWLSEGWSVGQEQHWSAPLYWHRRDETWLQFTLGGLGELDLAEPVSHVSYFEADAYARWAGYVLPTEAAWETAAEDVLVEGNFAEAGLRRPQAVAPHVESSNPKQLFGDLWEWTVSPYVAYPGYASPSGALGEYNGKFMCNQFVLRGGSFATPQAHFRPTYRNFFPPAGRWQFTGIRLARLPA
jgi:ergothioneine biosynthesis protein EgtB